MNPVPQRLAHRPTVVGCGLVALDVLLGKDVAVHYAGIGGTVGNVMSIMAYLGWRSVPMVRLGIDPAGIRVLQEMLALGVDTTHITLDVHVKTPVVYQRNGELAGEHSFSFRCPHCGQARRFSEHLLKGPEPDQEQPIAQRGDVYFFDRLTPASVELAEQAKANGALTVFEPSSAGEDSGLFHRALRASQVVKYSAERLMDSVLPALGAGFVEIQTLGAAGLRFRMRSLDPAWVTLPAIRTQHVVDTAGAGDWCTAGFLHIMSRQLLGGMLSDLGYNQIYSALRAGQAVAALNCQHTGARGLMRHIAATRLQEMLSTLTQLQSTLSGHESALSELGHLFPESAAAPSFSSRLDAQAALPLCCDAFPGTSRTGLELFH